MGIKFANIDAFVNALNAGALEHLTEGRLREEAHRCAHEIIEEIHTVIGTYSYGWTPLKPETVARKANGDTPLLETGKLRASYTTRIFRIRHGFRIRLSSSMPKIAFAHEFGTSKIPPRPLMKPAVKKIGQAAAARLGNAFVNTSGNPLPIP